jgi:hypothetical protein
MYPPIFPRIVGVTSRQKRQTAAVMGSMGEAATAAVERKHMLHIQEECNAAPVEGRQGNDAASGRVK